MLTSKVLWHHFEQVFGTKLTLRLGQIAELRNSIRHRRSLDRLTRKDGEPALVGFEAMLETE